MTISVRLTSRDFLQRGEVGFSNRHNRYRTRLEKALAFTLISRCRLRGPARSPLTGTRRALLNATPGPTGPQVIQQEGA